MKSNKQHEKKFSVSGNFVSASLSAEDAKSESTAAEQPPQVENHYFSTSSRNARNAYTMFQRVTKVASFPHRLKESITRPIAVRGRFSAS